MNVCSVCVCVCPQTAVAFTNYTQLTIYLFKHHQFPYWPIITSPCVPRRLHRLPLPHPPGTVHPAPAPPPPQLSPRLPRPTSDPAERPALGLPASQQVLSQASRAQRCVVRTGALVTPVRKQAVEGVGSRNTCYSRKTFTILGNK